MNDWQYQISSKKEYKDLIKQEKEIYFLGNKNTKEKEFRHIKIASVYKAVKALRKYEFLCCARDKTKNKLLEIIYSQRVKLADRSLNIKSEKVNIELTPGHFGFGTRISHGNVILFGKIGEKCKFHGFNTVGVKSDEDFPNNPTLGNRVYVGAGATIIGNIEIADDCVIAAGAVVTKSFLEKGSVIAGVPAKKVR